MRAALLRGQLRQRTTVFVVYDWIHLILKPWELTRTDQNPILMKRPQSLEPERTNTVDMRALEERSVR